MSGTSGFVVDIFFPLSFCCFYYQYRIYYFHTVDSLQTNWQEVELRIIFGNAFDVLLTHDKVEFSYNFFCSFQELYLWRPFWLIQGLQSLLTSLESSKTATQSSSDHQLQCKGRTDAFQNLGCKHLGSNQVYYNLPQHYNYLLSGTYYLKVYIHFNPKLH